VLRAKRARKLFHAMGNPAADNLKAIIWMNLIQNNIVTMDDINLATKVFGEDVRA
jgi:isopentenyl diphosphate isomerase/L-lactate dehydrogenase-like FMN-dependent dehydrogenase